MALVEGERLFDRALVVEPVEDIEVEHAADLAGQQPQLVDEPADGRLRTAELATEVAGPLGRRVQCDLHEFDADMLKSVTEGIFRIKRVIGIPVPVFPLGFAALLEPI